jgi:small subunit ribosomal protein S16
MRLQRIGRKNDPSYRVVVVDSRQGPKSGKHLDLVGTFSTKLDRAQIDAEKVKKWIANGTQVSDTVHNLLIKEKIIEGKKRNALPRKSPVIDEAKVKAEAEAKAKAEADAVAAKAAAEAEEAAKAAPVEEAPIEAPTEEVVEEKV